MRLLLFYNYNVIEIQPVYNKTREMLFPIFSPVAHNAVYNKGIESVTVLIQSDVQSQNFYVTHRFKCEIGEDDYLNLTQKGVIESRAAICWIKALDEDMKLKR